MAYVIKVCLDSDKYPKCIGCPHCRPDLKRGGDDSCFLDEDLKGKDRLDYLARLEKILQTKED